MDAAGTVCGRRRDDRRASRGSRRRHRRWRLAACLTVRRRDVRAGPTRRRPHVDAICGRGLDRGRLAPGRAHLDARLSPVPGVRRAAAGVVVLGMLISLQLGHARIAYSTCGSATASDARTSDASSAATTTCSSTNAPQTVYDQLSARLGGDLARALTTQQQLSPALDQTAASQQALTDQITQQETVISDLEDKVAQLDTLIQETQGRIDVERAQVTAMARTAYRQPKSLLEIVARAGSLRQALASTFELAVAGDRAHAVQAHLEADLLKQQADRTARLADLDRANGLHDQLLARMSELDDLLARQADLSSQLSDLVSQIQGAQDQLQGQPADVTATLASLLDQQ